MSNYDSLKKSHDFSELLDSYLKDIEDLRKKINLIREKFLRVQIPPKLKEALQFADEYIGLQIENWLTLCIKEFKKEFSSDIQERIVQIIENEQSHRQSINSQLKIGVEPDNEGYSYWEGILKKYVQGVLYLERKKKDPKSTSLEVLYSIAAGAAMFLSLFLGFLISSGGISIPTLTKGMFCR